MRSALPLLLCATLLSAPLTGCSKEESSSKSTEQSQPALSKEEALLQSPILKKIPATSIGFMVMDFEGEGYAKFKSSPWSSQMKGLGSLKSAIEEMKKAGADESQIAIVQSMFDSLQRLGLISPTGESQIEQVASKVAWFIDLPQNDPEMTVNAGLFVTGAKGANLKEKLPTLEAMMKERGVTVTKEQIAGVDVYAATLLAAEGAPMAGKIYLAANESSLAIARSKKSVEGFLKNDTPDGISPIRARPEFQKALTSVSGSDTPLALIYVSLKDAVPTIEKLSPEPSDGQQMSAKDFPIDAFIMRQSMGEQFSTKAAVVMSPKDETQKSVFQALEGASLPTTAGSIPGDSAVALSFDTKFLPKLEAVTKSVEGEAGEEGFKAISNLKGLTIAFRNNDGGSPVPDIFIGLEANNRDDLSKIVEAALGQGMAASGAPGMQWQSKDLDGTPVRYFTTLIGVGVYLASPKGTNTLLAASSERAMKDFLAASANGANSLQNTLKGPMKDRFAAAKLASTYVNFVQLANVIDSVKSSLAMLTGGANEIDKTIDTNSLRTWGTHVGSMAFTDGTLKIEATFDAAAPAGK